MSQVLRGSTGSQSQLKGQGHIEKGHQIQSHPQKSEFFLCLIVSWTQSCWLSVFKYWCCRLLYKMLSTIIFWLSRISNLNQFRLIWLHWLWYKFLEIKIHHTEYAWCLLSGVSYQYSRSLEQCEDSEEILLLIGCEPVTFRSNVLHCTLGPLL